MSDCIVICHQCVDDTTGRAKRWTWLCEICAADCADNHRKDTGHRDIEVRVTSDQAEVITALERATRRWFT